MVHAISSSNCWLRKIFQITQIKRADKVHRKKKNTPKTPQNFEKWPCCGANGKSTRAFFYQVSQSISKWKHRAVPAARHQPKLTENVIEFLLAFYPSVCWYQYNLPEHFDVVCFVNKEHFQTQLQKLCFLHPAMCFAMSGRFLLFKMVWKLWTCILYS